MFFYEFLVFLLVLYVLYVKFRVVLFLIRCCVSVFRSLTSEAWWALVLQGKGNVKPSGKPIPEPLPPLSPDASWFQRWRWNREMRARGLL